MPHWPALDGLRGLAVMAVMAYHLGHLSGGFLGVDLFFVLSGFLITSLLVREGDDRGRIDLRRFWVRRARRLLPALAATLVAVVVSARLFLDHGRLPSLRTDALATAAYIANWRFATQPQAGYFSADPSPLRHTWSLAIEEQYYLLWPLIVLGAVIVARRRGTAVATVVGAVAAIGAVASAGWMASRAGAWDIDRLYLGTDTRVAAPLVGALLACVLHRRRRRPASGLTASAHDSDLFSLTATIVGGLALGALSVAVVVVSATDGWLYRGGFVLAAAVGAGAVVGGVLGGEGPVGRLLALAPLRWVGERSYGLYLYSWPIQIMGRAQGLDRIGLSLVTVGISVAVAAASFRWLEMPVRRGTLSAPGQRPAKISGRRPEGLVARTAVAAFVVVVIGAVVIGTVTRARPDPLAVRTDEQLQRNALRPAVTVPSTTSGRRTPGAPVSPVRVLIVGDSIGYTLGEYAPGDLPDVAAVDSRALPGCSLLVSGTRPDAAIEAGSPETYDDCEQPVADADRLGLDGQPDVVLLVTGAWERSDHERGGDTVGPGDEGWTTDIQALLDERIDRLSATGARVALWADPCGADSEVRRRQEWFNEEVLRPVDDQRDEAFVVDATDVVCAGAEARADIDDVGDPRPDDGQHWSEEGAAWLWRSWLGPELRRGVAESDPGPVDGG